MAKQIYSDIADNGLARFAALATAGKTLRLRLLKAHALGDSHAAIVANTLASVTMAAGDFTLANDSTTGRKITTAAKSAIPVIADSGAAPDLHFAITNDTDSAPLATTDETSNIVISVGGGNNTVDVPALTWAITFAAT